MSLSERDVRTVRPNQTKRTPTLVRGGDAYHMLDRPAAIQQNPTRLDLIWIWSDLGP